MNFEQNERLEEWLLVIGDWFRTTNPRWFVALALVIVMAVPGYFFTAYAFSNILKATVSPIKINYTEPTTQPLQITERKIFDFGDGTYSGYARIKNVNSEWGVPELSYQALFKSSSGSTVMSLGGTAFILPSTDKVIVFPRFNASAKPSSLDVTFITPDFIRPPSLPNMNLEIQRKNIDAGTNQTLVNAVIVNHTPFKISRVDLPVLLFDKNNQIVGVNYTNINDLESNESRSFQYTWSAKINNVARIEIVPELNIYNRSLFELGPGQNPFETPTDE